MASDSSQSRWLRSNFMPVQSAFFFPGSFPPPAPRAWILARGHRPGARRTADRRVALLMQGVDGHFEIPGVAADVGVAPVRERVELLDAARRIRFLDRDGRARRGLPAAHPGDPGTL